MKKLEKQYKKESADIQFCPFIFSLEVSTENMVYFLSCQLPTSLTLHSDQCVPYTTYVGASTWDCNPKIVSVVPVTGLFKRTLLKGHGEYLWLCEIQVQGLIANKTSGHGFINMYLYLYLYNSRTVKFIFLMCAIQWILVYSQSFTTITTI